MALHLIFGAVLAATGANIATFVPDRTVMSDAYWRIWNEDVQRKMDSDIERYRKTDTAFPVEAPDGTIVRVEQISSAFRFGAQIFNFNQLGKKEWNDLYKELFGTLFNSATVSFYWRTLEPYPYAPRYQERYEDTETFWNGCPQPKDQPHWRRPPPDPVIDFLKTRGCRIHGHPLVWGNNAWHRPTWIWDDFCPDAEKRALRRKSGVEIPVANWRIPVGTNDRTTPFELSWSQMWQKVFSRMSEAEIAQTVPTFVREYERLYEKRIREIAERYGSRVDSWDVVNESAADFRDAQGGRAVRNVPCQKSLYGIMPGDYAYKGFVWAARYLPRTARLHLNDCTMADCLVRQAGDLEANGCRIDEIGSQMHLFDPGESVNIARGEGPDHLKPEGIAARFRLLSQAGKPIHLSEITITAPDNSERGQMVQAIILRNLYRAWFAVERMEGITWWNVVDDCGAPGEPSISGLFTRDMRPKTAYFAMNDLVNREWRTELEARTSGGQVKFRGFKGRYRLRWNVAGEEREKIVEANGAPESGVP